MYACEVCSSHSLRLNPSKGNDMEFEGVCVCHLSLCSHVVVVGHRDSILCWHVSLLPKQRSTTTAVLLATFRYEKGGQG